MYLSITIVRTVILPAIIALVTISSGAFAQNPDAGTTLFEFLSVKYNARSAAMAGASVGMPNELYGVSTNPASLAYLDHAQTCAGIRAEGMGVYGVPLAYAIPRADLGVFAFGAHVVTAGSINGTGVDGTGAQELTSTIARADYYAGSLSWARRFNGNAAAGVTVKGIYNYLGSAEEHYSADGFAVDGGLQYRFLNSKLIYGLAVRNIGFLRSGYTEDDSYPLASSIEMGMSYFVDSWRLALDLNKKRGDYLQFRPGLEKEILPRQLVARAGYAFSWRDAQAAVHVLQGEPEEDYHKSNRSTVCAGIGLYSTIAERKVKVDAAVEFGDVLSIMPAMTVSMLLDL